MEKKSLLNIFGVFISIAFLFVAKANVYAENLNSKPQWENVLLSQSGDGEDENEGNVDPKSDKETFDGEKKPPTICQFSSVILNSFNMIISIFPIVALGFMVYGAFLWATSGNNPQKVQISQKTLTNGILGLVIGLSAIALLGTLQKLLIGNEKFKWIGDGGVMRVDFCVSDYMDPDAN